MEAIDVDCEEESEEDEFDHDDDDFDENDENIDDNIDENDDENDGYKNYSKTTKRHLSHLNRRPRRPSSWRKQKKRNSSAVAAATVYMRHPASETSFCWRTAGVKDTSDTELHEGASYRLVATVKEVVPGVPGAAGGVVVTRCRLTLVTPGAT